MKRRIEVAILCGLAITVTLMLLSWIAIRLFPYRDLPTMPKPFFLYALSPGIIAGELASGHGWITEAAFFFVNAAVYSLAALAVREMISKVIGAKTMLR